MREALKEDLTTLSDGIKALKKMHGSGE